MGPKVALNHVTRYDYDKKVRLSPQIIRLKPAAHARTPIISYALKVEPAQHFINWIQDPYGNFLARVVFPEKTDHFHVSVDLLAELQVFNPFDFFLEPEYESWPFDTKPESHEDLIPYLNVRSTDKLFTDFAAKYPRDRVRSIDFLVGLNRYVQSAVSYRIRMEQNVQSPAHTLELGSGSCRDSALLLLELLRVFGVASRFVSGYLIQLVPDLKPRGELKGPERDFCDLHAWVEAYIPGAGWIGLDPTSGLLAGEGHIPLAASPWPGSASPVEGLLEPCEVRFDVVMNLNRIEDKARPQRPFPHGDRERIAALGAAVDQRIAALGFTLTQGAEPTFISDHNRSDAEWNGEALGPNKKGLSLELMQRLRELWAPGGIIHSAQGKWYPGESLPRWALSCFWRADGAPLWKNQSLLARDGDDSGHGMEDAERFIRTLVDCLGVNQAFVMPAYEDPMYFLQKERDLPVNVTAGDTKLKDPEERERLERVLSHGLDKPTGFVLPLQRGSWKSGPWPLRAGRLVLVPGDSPAGLRLPLDSLPWARPEDTEAWLPIDPTIRVKTTFPDQSKSKRDSRKKDEQKPAQLVQEQLVPPASPPLIPGESAAWVIRTALCVQAREGKIHVFFPPTRAAEDWFALAAEVEKAAEICGYPVVLEGYTPPSDPRILSFQITPDPGVIEVNMPPSATWSEWQTRLEQLYEAAGEGGLSTEKYQIGGQVTGTGGGCHWVMGGPQPLESPFLKRPDLLRSWITFTNRHPSMSYLFSGLFVGASSQAPRPDEAQLESIPDIELAFKELERQGSKIQPWLADRLFRNLLIDSTGNTHRTEMCIDKLYSPDSSGGRRGLVEFRSWEMACHPDLALSQSLLLRALTLHFMEKPYIQALERWGTALRDRWMLPYFLGKDIKEILDYLDGEGLVFPREPFEAHEDFRFPLLGSFVYEGMETQLRPALEPWPVVGEEPGAGGTVRYVDSSVERVEVRVKNWQPDRFVFACRGRQIPLQLQPDGSGVAGVRFKAWKLHSGLHPTMAVDGTLIIDVVDLWNHRVVSGCTYHVSHPAGRNYDEAPINAFEAEARRSARFSAQGHSTLPLTQLPRLEVSLDFPHTLDLRT